MSHPERLTRAQKAAAILVAMGKPAAGRMLKFFKPEELKALIEGARKLKTISQAELDRVVAEFEDEFTEGVGLLDSADTMDTLLNETLTPEEVSAIMDEHKTTTKEEGPPPIWPQLEQLPPERLAGLVQGEHPQTVAMILANLKQGAAAAAIVALPKTTRGDVVKRMMSLNKVSEGAKRLVEDQLRTRLDTPGTTRDSSEGQMRVAGMLNQLDKTELDELMSEMEAAGAPDLDKLRAKLFSFEEIVRLSDTARVKLFDGLATDLVTTALRGAPAAVTEAVLGSLGARSRRMIESELSSASSNMRPDDIAKARKTIAAAAIRLAGSGAIELPGSQAEAA